MRIVKKISDYDLNQAQKAFAEFFEGKTANTGCSEKILNPEFLSEYVRPKNDFLIYTTAQPGSEARRLVR